MIAIDRKRNRQREHFRSAKKSPENNLPIVESLLSENTQADARTYNCQQTLKIQGGPHRWSLIFPKEGPCPLIVMLG